MFETRLAAGASDELLRAPITDDDPEAAQNTVIDAHLNRRLAEGVRSWSKSGHLQRMTESGVFAWCREVALASEETGDAERFVQLLQSQGDYQTLRRRGLDDELLGVDRSPLWPAGGSVSSGGRGSSSTALGSASPLNVTTWT